MWPHQRSAFGDLWFKYYMLKYVLVNGYAYDSINRNFSETWVLQSLNPA